MAKPRVIIADTEVNYVIPLQLKFGEDFFEKVDLEIITDGEFFRNEFATPQRADILIVSEELYDASLQRHNISNIFLMTEQAGGEQNENPGVTQIYKYTSIKEIFNEIISKSAGVLAVEGKEKKETQIILVYSACGGVGKTTVAMGISAGLAQNFKNVLYINAAHLQTFQEKMSNQTAITASEIYTKLVGGVEDVYSEVKHVIRREQFSYVPPFKTALVSMGIPYSVYEKLALSAKKSKDFDYIVLDADSTFDEDKIRLLGIADKVVIVTEQTTASVYATNKLFDNLSDMTSDRYIFICNDFEKDKSNALIMPDLTKRFAISEYVSHYIGYDQMTCVEYAEDSGIQKALFLVM